MMAAPPQLDAIEESPLKGCALLGSPVFDEHEDNQFELFNARIAAADTAYELAVAESKYESRREARRRAYADAEARREARPQSLEDAIASVAHMIGDVPDAVDDGLTPRSSLRRACEDATAFLAEEAAEPALPSPGPRETDHSPPRTRTPARTEEAAGDESDGSEDSGDGILAADYEGPGANRRGNVGADDDAAPAPAADEDDDSSDWSSSAEAPAPAPLDDDDDVSIVSVSSATAEDASERLSRAEGYAERYPAKAAKVLRPCITAWRGGAPIDYASNPDVGPVLAVSCCYAYARATANVAVQDGACGENSPALVADALEALDQALELDPAHAPSTRLRGRLLPLLGEALCPRKIRASFRPE